MLKKINKAFAVAIALTFAFGATSISASAADMNSWKKAVAKKVAKKQKYPRAALGAKLKARQKFACMSLPMAQSRPTKLFRKPARKFWIKKSRNWLSA